MPFYTKINNNKIEIRCTSKDIIENHLENALDFQSSKYKNGMVLIYAWNEFDEGGFIEPTISKNNEINTDKLEVIKKVINKYNT